MPAYHSVHNTVEAQLLGNMSFLPFDTKVRGPLQTLPLPIDSDDIAEEALNLFRANCLFKNYEIKGPADRTLIYATLFISECLAFIQKSHSGKSKEEMTRALNNLALQSFAIPGDVAFPLNALFAPPADRQQADLLRQYLSQLRQELAIRIMDRVYQNSEIPSKWWMMFAKRKFMGKSF